MKTIWKILLIMLCFIIIFILYISFFKCVISKDKEPIILHLKLGKAYSFTHNNIPFRVTYCGIVNDKIFSISGKGYTNGYNIYYPIGKKQIQLYRHNHSILFTITYLNSNVLCLRQLK